MMKSEREESQLGLQESSIITKSLKSPSDNAKQRHFRVVFFGEDLDCKLSKSAHWYLTLFYLFYVISNDFYVLIFFKNLSKRAWLLPLESGIHTFSTRVTNHSLPFSCPCLNVSLRVLWEYLHTVACGQYSVTHQDCESIRPEVLSCNDMRPVSQS